MRLSVSFATLLVAAAVACGRPDVPTSLGTSATIQLVPTANSPCTVHWAAGVNGSWFDATKWNPAGVPGATSSVCVDASGTYTVSVDPANDATPVSILALKVAGTNGTATVNLDGDATILNVQEGIDVAAGGSFALRNYTGATITTNQTFTNAGTLAAIALCGNCGSQNVINADLLNQGTITGAAVLTLGKVNGAYQNTGTINLTTGTIVIPATAGNPTFAQDGGVVMAQGNFTTLTMFAGTYTANGGELRQRNAANPKPIVVLDGANLVLGANTSPAVIGVKGSAGTAPTITGDIPALTTLWLAGPANQTGAISFVGNPTNAGTIIPVHAIDGNTGILNLTGSGRLTNSGSILQSRSSGSALTFHYQIDVTNNGTISTTDGTHINFDKAGGAYENHGSIALGALSSVMQLRIVGSTLLNTGGSIDGGSVIVDGGRLLGTAPITSDLQASNGGSVEPGNSPGIMPIRSFRPLPTGVLRIELGGIAPGTEYDQLQATLTSGGLGSVATLGGTLDLVEVNGFQSGQCGQVFDVLVHSMASGYGSFATVNGLTPGAGRALRVVYVNATAGNPGTGRVRLVGYDANAAVCVGPNPVALSEGAAGTQYAVLLNHAPSASVTVTAQPDAQVTVSPQQLVFNTSNWQQPQFITVTAVDDALQEGPHTGGVTHSVASTDASFAGFVPASLTANIADNDVNNPPVVGNDSRTTVEETPVTIDVLANDSDPEGAPLTVSGVTAASHGSAQILGGGASIRYTPSLNYSGPDQFSYTVSDGQGGSSSATVSITVTPINDVPVAADDQSVTRPARVTVLNVVANDTDGDGDPLTVTQVSSPGHGTVVIDPGAQSVTYKSVAGYVGTDAFTYTISDGAGGTDVASVFLDIVTGNTPPVAVADAASLKSSTGSVKINVLQNDSDPENDKFQIIGVSAPSYGTATISGHSITYTIGLSTAGNDLFTYTIQDALGATATGVVTVTWPLPPPPPPPPQSPPPQPPPPTTLGDMSVSLSYSFFMLNTGGQGFAVGATVRYTGPNPPPLADPVVVFDFPGASSIKPQYTSSDIRINRSSFPFTVSFQAHIYIGAVQPGFQMPFTVRLMQSTGGAPWDNLVPYSDNNPANNSTSIIVKYP